MITTMPTTTTFQPDSVRKEPFAIVDTTGSMFESVSPNSNQNKAQFATDVMRILAQDLANADSQSADEGGKGGLLTVTFADGIAKVLGDLNPQNFESKWGTVRWGGGTYITPAFEKMMELYKDEFGDLPTEVQPEIAAIVITDGELSDLNTANLWLRKAGGKVHVYVFVVGFGVEHDKAIASWQNVAEANPHVRVETATGSTNAHELASRILAMVQ
jgi:uncharacterized protein YegL